MEIEKKARKRKRTKTTATPSNDRHKKGARKHTSPFDTILGPMHLRQDLSRLGKVNLDANLDDVAVYEEREYDALLSTMYIQTAGIDQDSYDGRFSTDSYDDKKEYNKALLEHAALCRSRMDSMSTRKSCRKHVRVPLPDMYTAWSASDASLNLTDPSLNSVDPCCLLTARERTQIEKTQPFRDLRTKVAAMICAQKRGDNSRLQLTDKCIARIEKMGFLRGNLRRSFASPDARFKTRFFIMTANRPFALFLFSTRGDEDRLQYYIYAYESNALVQ